MKKIFFEDLYCLIATSLCFAITLTFIRILPFEWLNYSIAYDILAICCGFLVAIILIKCSRLKSLCFASLLFVVYFLLFRIPFVAIMTALCAFVLQVLSLYLRGKIKFFLIFSSFSILLFMACSGDFMRLIFLLQFIFWWHILWFVLLSVALKIANIRNP